MNHNESIDFLIKSLQTQMSVNQNLIARMNKAERSVIATDIVLFLLCTVVGLIVGYLGKI